MTDLLGGLRISNSQSRNVLPNLNPSASTNIRATNLMSNPSLGNTNNNNNIAPGN